MSRRITESELEDLSNAVIETLLQHMPSHIEWLRKSVMDKVGPILEPLDGPSQEAAAATLANTIVKLTISEALRQTPEIRGHNVGVYASVILGDLADSINDVVAERQRAHQGHVQ